jgi:hypothetical protein
MRKVFTILALALFLVTSAVDLGQSKSSPYDPADYLSGSPTDDHPWGGDDTDGDGTTGGSTAIRPTYSAATGNVVIDLFTKHVMHSRMFRTWLRRGFDRPVINQPLVTPATNPTQSN